MKAKIKIIEAFSSKSLQVEVNEFLKRLDPNNVKNISMDKQSNMSYSALILYVA